MPTERFFLKTGHGELLENGVSFIHYFLMLSVFRRLKRLLIGLKKKG